MYEENTSNGAIGILALIIWCGFVFVTAKSFHVWKYFSDRSETHSEISRIAWQTTIASMAGAMLGIPLGATMIGFSVLIIITFDISGVPFWFYVVIYFASVQVGSIRYFIKEGLGNMK